MPTGNPTHMLKLNLQRAASYIDRLPLFTRLVIVLMVACEAVRIFLPWWDIQAWGRLEPDQIGLQTMYRTNTYALLHTDVFHLLLNLFAVIPMLERFEAEHGTLTSLALFFGPLSTVPALMYVAIEKFLLRSNTSVVGASIWGFVLLAIEAVRQHRTTPYLVINGQPTIPTWSTPFAALLAVAVLVPSSSILGHLCGLALGYLCGTGYLNIKYLAPPEKVLRWIEGKAKLRDWLPYYVSVDQKVYGRFGVLPLANLGAAPAVAPGLAGSSQRLGPTPE
ncbi:hypothetical protein N658DRAFT_497874 [Parathielavia hyrcaniae]|uniref:rhomboid protease n=1 Tax=Parathielavia hyrcaniae TaxID=113614 RepID=A0AAN6SZU9_9PEZI|nr:hypothetical protein N658DRAFT_497874 [Parathielavia hyrcaniae]